MATHWTLPPILPELEAIYHTHLATHAQLPREDINYATFNKPWRQLHRDLLRLNNHITKGRVDNVSEKIQDISEKVNAMHSGVKDYVQQTQGVGTSL
ncbi:hypothetical protein EMPS_06590 [Entomortierella parvispora]|uniref:Uncharacterized protein n=1 Tax=Entomortierella parvispora TaxID=205924 RepID=A0A9P3HCQ6_9FUNG|nr:hypothetical protein EMPS_06590 [Entomortierella parvispora]